MIVRMIVHTLLWLVGMGALLFGAAGTLAWPNAWWLLLEMGVLSIGAGWWLAVTDPALLAERMSVFGQRGQSRFDRVFMPCAAIGWTAWLVLMGIDAVRVRWSQVPPALSVLGALGICVCIVFTLFVFRANSYAAPVVKLQAERGHRVIDFGPYAVVRHPMYAGAILYLAGMPLLLGSWLGLACVPLLVAGIGWRAVLEERILAAQLDGYAAYMRKVRYRFVPYVW
ncbi:methyltransferase family protein [Paraburkholderia phosphatilytica]|uniref:methyltransferase family protein n=1 Tax=Paraburkholderia phosphatilytica TaxID=2282883 RepID=UPI000E472060|nr:isoprenylcysteine carboxylmethyltransferase family protein [Paraburkholderia phosphatilytica]